MDVQTVMSVCAKYNRIIRGFGGYCATDFRRIVGKGSLEVGNMKGYLYTVVRNRAVKYVKKDQEKVSVESAMYLTDENILSISVEEEALVWNWIDALPTERRNIFLMAKQQGMKYKEIAEQLDISVKTVEGQLGKALKTLRDKAIKIYLFFFG